MENESYVFDEEGARRIVTAVRAVERAEFPTDPLKVSSAIRDTRSLACKVIVGGPLHDGLYPAKFVVKGSAVGVRGTRWVNLTTNTQDCWLDVSSILNPQPGAVFSALMIGLTDFDNTPLCLHSEACPTIGDIQTCNHATIPDFFSPVNFTEMSFLGSIFLNTPGLYRLHGKVTFALKTSTTGFPCAVQMCLMKGLSSPPIPGTIITQSGPSVANIQEINTKSFVTDYISAGGESISWGGLMTPSVGVWSDVKVGGGFNADINIYTDVAELGYDLISDNGCSPSITNSCGSGGSGSGGGMCPCGTLPTTLHVTFTGPLAAMGTVTLTYNATLNEWDGSGVACGGTINIAFLACPPQGSYVRYALNVLFTGEGGGGDVGLPPISISCHPLAITFSFDAIFGTCDGVVNATVTT